MTHPSEIKPREGDGPGTRAHEFIIGAGLPAVRFTVTPDIVRAYCDAVGWKELPALHGRPVAPTTVLTLYQTAVLYRRFPPPQGIILREQEWWWRGVMWADEDTNLVASGQVLERFERRGRSYVKWAAEFTTTEQQPIALSHCTLYVPDETK